MRTIEVNLYQFGELSDSAKEVARKRHREIIHEDNFWSEFAIEEAIEFGKLMGFDFKMRAIPLHGGRTRQEPCVYWTGFSSQGDGACFEASWSAKAVQTGKVKENAPTDELLGRIARIFEEVGAQFPTATFTVSHSGRYYHKNSTIFDVDSGVESDDEMTEKVAKFGDFANTEEALIEVTRDFMEWIYRQLEKANDYEYSDECVNQYLNDSDTEYTEDGERA